MAPSNAISFRYCCDGALWQRSGGASDELTLSLATSHAVSHAVSLAVSLAASLAASLAVSHAVLFAISLAVSLDLLPPCAASSDDLLAQTTWP